MLNDATCFKKIFIVTGYTDLRSGIPVIVIYPEFKKKSDIVDSKGNFKKQIKDLWDKLPKFRDSMGNVATVHIPLDKETITNALNAEEFMVNTMAEAKQYYYEP